MTRHQAIPIILLACALGACYSQQPLQTVPPPPATHVVAQLTDSGTVVMGNALGQGVVRVEGLVTNADDKSWTMEMLRVDERGDRSVDWNHEVVTFPSHVLVNPEMIKLDKKRSWLAAGGITIGAFVLARAFNVIGSNDNKGDQTPPQQTLIGGRNP